MHALYARPGKIPPSDRLLPEVSQIHQKFANTYTSDNG